MQSAILSGKQFELYADCERLIPSDIRPVADKKELVIEPFDPEHMGLGRKPVATGRRKRDEDDDIELFQTGFQKANGGKVDSKTPKIPAKRKKTVLSEPEAVIDESPLLSEAERQGVTRRLNALPITIQPSSSTLRAQTLPRKVPSVIPASKRMLGTSARTASLFKALQAGQELSADSDKNKAWEIETYSAFKSSNVQWWPEDRVGTGRDRPFRLLGPCHALPAEAVSHSTNVAPIPSTTAKSEAIARPGEVTGLDDEENSSESELPDLPVQAHQSGQSSSAPKSAQAAIYLNKTSDKPQPTPNISRLSGSAVKIATNHGKPPRANPIIHSSLPVVDHTIIEIGDSDDDLGAADDVQKVSKVDKPTFNSAKKTTPGKAKTLDDAVTDLDNSFDDELDSSACLAIDLGPTTRGSPNKPAADERVRPESPKLTTIVST